MGLEKIWFAAVFGVVWLSNGFKMVARWSQKWEDRGPFRYLRTPLILKLKLSFGNEKK